MPEATIDRLRALTASEEGLSCAVWRRDRVLGRERQPAGDLADVVLRLPALLERERAVQADLAAGLGLSRQRP